MVSDMELKMEGKAVLLERLGIVEVERFIALLQREKFDYTQWREGHWEGKSINELSAAAMEYRKSHTE